MQQIYVVRTYDRIDRSGVEHVPELVEHSKLAVSKEPAGIANIVVGDVYS